MSHEPSRPPRRSRWRRVAWTVVTELGVAAAVGGAWFAANTGSDTAGKAPAVAPATAQITRADLAETQQVDGTLGYGDESLANGGLTGVITWLPAEGATVTRGKP